MREIRSGASSRDRARACDDRSLAVIDIWRLIDGRITGHWHADQPVPDDEQIPNGTF
ncbi:hypothetical protein ACFYO1_09565 [Nocardia sp. NPDC006044]|uniref:hypothetical protein n=1 Tax=Nocardia sp. NPDC006044 TaxID=3364306 RepID=UPI0036A6F2EB